MVTSKKDGRPIWTHLLCVIRRGRGIVGKATARPWAWLVLVAMWFVTPGLAYAQTPEAIRAQVAQPEVVAEASKFYERRAFEPAWFEEGRLRHAAMAVATALQHADQHGLRPSDYRTEQVVTELRRTARSDAQAALLEVLLTDGVMRYGRHQVQGRVEARRFHPGWNLPHRSMDLGAALEASLRADTVDALLAHLPPPAPEYAALQQALLRYRALATAGGWPVVPVGASLRQGDIHSRVTILRARLQATGDLKRPAEADTSSTLVFDAAVDRAVHAFQQRHGLTVDGIVGPETREALNVPVEDRVRQILLNLERWRWMPSDLQMPRVEVNIPAFTLRVVEQDTAVLAMRAIVGTTRLPTPVFSAAITELVLAPYWHIPISIAEREVLPRLRRDPGYLRRNGIRRLPSGRLRQEPGPANPLGQVKFTMPNPHGVLLHDTPSRTLFQQSRCAFSHGCIRIQRPLALAEYVVREDTTWTRPAMEDTLRTAKDAHIPVSTPLTVYVLYQTAWMDADGVVHFRRDVYGHDARLESVLGLQR